MKAKEDLLLARDKIRCFNVVIVSKICILKLSRKRKIIIIIIIIIIITIINNKIKTKIKMTTNLK